MLHWRLSSAAGFLLTGRYQPVCALVWGLPDCAARRAFGRAMERAFAQPDHCRIIRDTYLIGRTLRDDARLNALADERAAGPFVPVTLDEL